VNRFARLLPLLRNSLIILGTLVVAIGLAYLLDRSTDRRPASMTPAVDDGLKQDGPKPAVLSRDELAREKEVHLYGYDYRGRYRIGKTLEFGDNSLLCVFRSDFMADFKREFGARICTEERPTPTPLAVVSAVLRELQLSLRRTGGDEAALATIVDFLTIRTLPSLDHEARYWKETYGHRQDAQGLWVIELISEFGTRQRLQAEREGREPDETAFRAALRRIPKAYALYIDSLTVGRSQAIGLIDELLRLPTEERRPLEAIARYRRARLSMHLEDWAALGDADVRKRLAVIRADLESVPVHVRNGALDPALISENVVYWLAYARSMILPAERLQRLDEADFAGAMATYLRMPMRGPANAVSSCYLLAQKLCGEKYFGPAVQDPDVRRIITLYLAAGGSNNADARLSDEEAPGACSAWLDALAAAGVSHEFDPRRLALIACMARRWSECLRTITLLPADDPLRPLLASRCNLRLTGEVGASRRLLDPATHAPAMDALRRFEGSPRQAGKEKDLVVFIDFNDPSELGRRASAELGVTALHLGDFPEGLSRFLEAGSQEEADYVAECLLTTPELEAFVAQGVRHKDFGGSLGRDHVRRLLASRLFRAGRMEEALEHTPDDIAPQARTFVLLLRLAERTELAHRTRADAYWRAALTIGDIGETILHAPLGLSWTADGSHRKPDSNWYVGYGFLPYNRLNKEREYEHAPRHHLIGPGQAETKRLHQWLDAHVIKPVRSERDARYATFDLALKAARLLPDNDPAGGMILQYAGNLLKFREPKAANPAYQLLVTRFKETPYGAHALKAHWFSAERPSPPADIISK
jgi:hypothetical protein